MNAKKLPYQSLRVIESRLNERLPPYVDIFDDLQWRMSRIRDRVRVAINNQHLENWRPDNVQGN